MDGEQLKYQIGTNIAACRKRANLTQAGLAEKLNYSDKAVSKWERGESMPDVLTLVQLAELFGVSVNVLLSDPNALPDGGEDLETPTPEETDAAPKRKANRGVIQMLSSLLVWGIALLVYVILSSVGLPKGWVSFAYAIPINAIVLLSLRSAWHDFSWNQALISTIVWGCLLGLHITLLVFCHVNAWRIYLLGVPGQASIVLWFRLFCAPRQKGEETDG